MKHKQSLLYWWAVPCMSAIVLWLLVFLFLTWEAGVMLNIAAYLVCCAVTGIGKAYLNIFNDLYDQ